jgi:hypothetical protein
MDFAPASMMRLVEPAMGPGNQFQCGAVARDRATHVIESSPDYVNWSPIVTNEQNACPFIDPSPATGFLNYRMRQLP